MLRFPHLILILAAFLLLCGCTAPKDPNGMLAAPMGGPSPELTKGSPADMLGLPAYVRPGEGAGAETNKETAP